ncbi:MAG TPA: hypothetical protein VFL94_01630 [Actinomycetales bacterium]|nr:hypothetical protein [Actinomycetales bacterium]
MSKKQFLKVTGFIGTLGAGAALVATAATGTGAYFTDSASGTISGTMGTIQIQGADGNPDNMNISFTKMLPGETGRDTVTFKNIGQNPQDVWVVFPQSALGDGSTSTPNDGVNDFGTYATIQIKSSGTQVFYSNNLNDDTTSCPPGSVKPGVNRPCHALPSMIKLADNVAPGAGGNMEFAFTPDAQFRSNQGLPVLNLPYKLVATQHGIAPNNALNAAF